MLAAFQLDKLLRSMIRCDLQAVCWTAWVWHVYCALTLFTWDSTYVNCGHVSSMFYLDCLCILMQYSCTCLQTVWKSMGQNIIDVVHCISQSEKMTLCINSALWMLTVHKRSVKSTESHRRFQACQTVEGTKNIYGLVHASWLLYSNNWIQHLVYLLILVTWDIVIPYSSEACFHVGSVDLVCCCTLQICMKGMRANNSLLTCGRLLF